MKTRKTLKGLFVVAMVLALVMTGCPDAINLENIGNNNGNGNDIGNNNGNNNGNDSGNNSDDSNRNPGTPGVPSTPDEPGGPITSVSLTVMRPIVGDAQDKTVYGVGNFSAGTVTWSPTHSVFQEGIKYTATFVLTAYNGYTFDGLETATVRGEDAVISDNNGATVILSYQFPATSDSITRDKFYIESFPGSDKERIKFSYSFGEYDYYYIYMGSMTNIPIFSFDIVEQKDALPVNGYAVTYANQNSTAIQNTVSKSSQNAIKTMNEDSTSSTFKASAEVIAEAGYKGFGFSASVKATASTSWEQFSASKRTEMREQITSFEETVTNASEFVETVIAKT